MKPKITHDFVNQRIIDRLNEIGYNRFHENMQRGYSEFDVDYVLDGKYQFNTVFEIRESTISKDTEYHAKNSRTGNDVAFCIVSSDKRFKNNEGEWIYKNKPTLQELFDKWYNGYLKWLYDCEIESRNIDLTNDILNQKMR